MKRKFLALLWTLTITLSLAAPALGAEPAAPTPPPWCPAEEYAVFEPGTAYQGETWETLSQLRAHAADGNLEPKSGTDTVLYNRFRALAHSSDPGVCFETGLLSLKFALNAADQGQAARVGSDFEMAAYYASGQEPARYLAYLWNARASLWDNDLSTELNGELRFFIGAIEPLLSYPQFSMDQVLEWGRAQGIPAEKLEIAQSLLFVTLDGDVVHPRAVRYNANYVDTSTAQVRRDRTMVPVRRLAELMGATVAYDAPTQQVTITRAGDTFVMTLDSTSALRNGESFQMDVAPYAENGRTYIPIRYIAEFFGQKVEWHGERQQVAITEDKSVAGNSNLEAWALAMGAVLNQENKTNSAGLFGGIRRFGANPVGGEVSNQLETTGTDFGRKVLQEGWGIQDREKLMETIQALSVLAGDYPAWDLFRVSNLAQWGYLAGYVTYPEALALVEPAARCLCETFSSWDEAYENYLGGYLRWAGADEPGQDVWETERGARYLEMKADPAVAPLFDDALFQTGVIGMPE